MWSFLAVANNVCVPWSTVNWHICIMVHLPWHVGLSVLLLFLHYPIYRDDYCTSQTAVHCKLFTDFVNRPCSWRTRTTRRATQFVLTGWGHFSIVQSGRLICKFYARNFWAPYFASDLKNCLVMIILQHTVYIYLCLHIIIQYESGLCGVDSCSYSRRVCVCRTSIIVVKALTEFVEQMSDNDVLLQSVCWTVSCVAFATDG